MYRISSQKRLHPFEQTSQKLSEKYLKKVGFFLGVVHCIDRPVSGGILFARTSKALARLNQILQNRQWEKVYWELKQAEKKSINGLRYGKARQQKSNIGL